TILRNYIQNHGTGGNWIALPHKAGLKRCGKSCRLRWLNYLRPDIKLGGFTEEEDNIISSLYANIGSRWSVIASHLQGRTDNDVKNHWNTKLKKKVSTSHNSAAIKSNDSTPISAKQYSSSAFLPKQEVEQYQITNASVVDYTMNVSYQQQSTISNSNINNFNNTTTLQENQLLPHNAYTTANDYASWCDNGGVMDLNGDVLAGEFSFEQVIGEVANFSYPSQLWL
ncbi:hypothetical protein M8C21_025442, partial [Ambrosia artemisiifolia]